MPAFGGTNPWANYNPPTPWKPQGGGGGAGGYPGPANISPMGNWQREAINTGWSQGMGEAQNRDTWNNTWNLDQFQDPNAEWLNYTNPYTGQRNTVKNPNYQPPGEAATFTRGTPNWGALTGLFGGAGPAMPKAPEWSYTAPEAYTPYEFETAGMVDPSAVMKSMDPYFQEQRERGFAEAAARMGPSSRGMTASTPYSEALGGVARRSAEDINRIAAEYQYKAAEEAAARQLQQQLAKQQEAFGAWQTGAGMHQQAEMGRNQFGLDLYGGQLQAQQQQAQQQQAKVDQMLPFLLEQMYASGQTPDLSWLAMNPGAGRFVG